MSHARIRYLLVKIDEMLASQLKEITEQADFMHLQVSWLGLYYLMQQQEANKTIYLKLWDVKWCELRDDMLRYGDVEHTQLYQHVNDEAFDMPGGDPFALIVGHYELDINSVSNPNASRDMTAIQAIAETMSAAFSLFVMGLHASAFGFNEYSQMSGHERPVVDSTMPHYARWQRFRQSADSRFIVLTAPKMRWRPYWDEQVSAQRMLTEVNTELWGVSTFAYAAIVMRSFSQTNWFIDSIGIPNQSAESQGGLVPVLVSQTGLYLSPKLMTDVLVNAEQEEYLNASGVTALSHLPKTAEICFIHSPTLKYNAVDQDRLQPDQLANLSPHLLCICRFAHHLKIMGRNYLGKYQSLADCQQSLQNWLNQYIASNDDIHTSMKARFPLHQGTVQLQFKPGRRDQYICTMRLSPHVRTAQTCAVLVLQTVLTNTVL